MGSRGGGGGVGVLSIPAASRKMVQSLKEIVNCPEPEIYAVLKDCNMDPNEAVNRLLSQDPFHEVKSKREKKKETKDPTESRPRGSGSTSNRGGRSAADRYAGRGGSAQFSSSESGGLQGKPSYRKENGMSSYTGSSASVSGVAGNNSSQRPPTLSDSIVSGVDGITSGLQPPSGYQSAWLGAPGQKSMADIVKMGRPQSKSYNTPTPSYHNVEQNFPPVPVSTSTNQTSRSSEDYASKDSGQHHDLGAASDQHVSPDNEWPRIEPPEVASMPSALEPHDTELHLGTSNLSYDRSDQYPGSQTDDVHEENDSTFEDHRSNNVESASVSLRKTQEDNTGSTTLYDEEVYNNMGSFHTQEHAYEHQEVVDIDASVSSVNANIQQLSIQEEDHGTAPEDDGPSVVIPNHLQVQNADCSHLSFGSFGSAMNTAFSGSFATRAVLNNLEETPAEADAPSAGHSDSRNEYYGDESLRTSPDGNLALRIGGNAGAYDSATASQPEALKQENAEVAHGSQYTFPSGTPGYNFENAQLLNTSYPQSQASVQMQNLTPFSNPMQQAYTNSLPSSLLGANGHPVRESDLPYSPFPTAQSMPTKYNTVSSINSSTISMAEALKTVGFSSTQQAAQQTLPGNNVATGPALPQHLSVHPYPQPTLPLGPFTNMISYPFLPPQSYTYMPSGFQQAFAGNSTYHQSLAAAVLPQYKNSVSASSLPQSAAVAPGYGAFGSSANYPMNPPPQAAPAGSNISYDDLLSSQYKDNSHLLSLQQQAENSAMWLHGAGSRTMSAVPGNTYYSFQGQNQQQAGGFRQGQQQSSQNFGAPGYPNYYHSQTGISLEHHQQQQQNPRDGGSQGQPKQSQQIWQNGY